MTKTKIITTVGTSVFTNLISTDKEIQGVFKQIDGKPYEKWESQKDYIEGRTGLSQTKGLRQLTWEKINQNKNASAEITSVLNIVQELGHHNVEVHLIATDTIVGVLACELIQQWFQNYEQERITAIFDKSKYIIADLRIDTRENYENGIMNLIEQLDTLNLTSKDILNITGGYKATIPIMTIYAQIKQIPLYYIYNEKADQNSPNALMSIGVFPVQFDAVFAESYYPYLQNTRLLTKLQDKDKHILTEKYRLMQRRGNDYTLTPLGELYKKYIDQNLAESKQVFGFLVEYKLFEYYLKNSYLTKTTKAKLTQVERSKKDIFTNEVDLCMWNESTMVIGEIKSYLSVCIDENFEKLKEQVKKQIDNLKKDIAEYALYIYMNNMQGNGFGIMNQHQGKLGKLQDIVQSKVKVFRVFLVFITHNEVSENTHYQNVYMNFMHNPLKPKEYNLNSK